MIEPLRKHNFIKDCREYGFDTAWYNARFLFAYWLLGAKSMKVRRKVRRKK